MILHHFVFLFVVLLVTPTPGRAISIELGPRGSDVLIDLTDLEDAGIIIDTGRHGRIGIPMRGQGQQPP